MKEDIIQRLGSIRRLMLQNSIDAYIINSSDPHASEYMADYWAEMNWASSFKGEAGVLLLTMDKALLWTDSRYYLQAEKELAGTDIALMRASDIDCPSINRWITDHFVKDGGAVVGINAEMYTANAYSALREELQQHNIALRNIDLISVLWKDGRPSIPMSPLRIYSESYSGEGVLGKISRIREEMKSVFADVLIISALDEIGWLLNIRGNDVFYTPCLICYVVLELDRCSLFIDGRKVDDKAASYLSENGISVYPYESVYTYISELQGRSIVYDGGRVNQELVSAILEGNRTMNISPSPTLLAMSKKNAIEIEGTRKAMVRDGVALTRFFMWFDRCVDSSEQEISDEKGVLTEVALADKLHGFRVKQENFCEESFATIAAFGANGAIVHYHAEENDCSYIMRDNVLLLDSGGQYLDGTTDITRTIWIGNDLSHIPNEVKHDYTLVLKGHIALANAVFPAGTRGNQLDVLAHQYMWKEGIHYSHGTGHGVGHYMGCHEGPQNIRTDNNPNPLQLGNICSDEPGIYREGSYGIRIENLVLVSPSDAFYRSTGEDYFHFDTLTLCFYDTRLIDSDMITSEERQWINDYHHKVYELLSPFLTEEEKEYLRLKCADI